ncbi:MAG: amidohydrolase family protein [Spirochaetota bacterium]
MDRIDAHIHLAGDDDATRALLEEIGIVALNICVATGAWRETVHPRFRSLAASHPDRYAWCTSFDLPDPDGDHGSWAERVIAALKEDLRDGAVAVKAWKNIGMELRRADGSWVMIDDPLFDPIYAFLARESVPMVMHIGEPLACWEPLDERSPHYTYYRDHPQWHLCGRTDVPSHADLVAARDRVLAKHPELRVVGAHLGSLEYDVGEVAERLDRYPNFAVDISARLGDLMRQRASDVAEFLTRYADRVIFGTGRVEFARQSSPGLGLPDDVVVKITSTTARTWFPALA